jgi:hypothetical protein
MSTHGARARTGPARPCGWGCGSRWLQTWAKTRLLRSGHGRCTRVIRVLDAGNVEVAGLAFGHFFEFRLQMFAQGFHRAVLSVRRSVAALICASSSPSLALASTASNSARSSSWWCSKITSAKKITRVFSANLRARSAARSRSGSSAIACKCRMMPSCECEKLWMGALAVLGWDARELVGHGGHLGFEGWWWLQVIGRLWP